MPSIKNILSGAVAGLAAFASALPAQPKLSSRALHAYNHKLAARQAANAAATAAGINDIDILQL